MKKLHLVVGDTLQVTVMPRGALQYRDENDPWDGEQVFWERIQFGDEVTRAERQDRFTYAMAVFQAWKAVKDVAFPRHPTDILANEVCGRLVTVFGFVTKQRDDYARVLLCDLEKAGQHAESVLAAQLARITRLQDVAPYRDVSGS
jgi:hypothetical protein